MAETGTYRMLQRASHPELACSCMPSQGRERRAGMFANECKLGHLRAFHATLDAGATHAVWIIPATTIIVSHDAFLTPCLPPSHKGCELHSRGFRPSMHMLLTNSRPRPVPELDMDPAMHPA